MVNVYDHAHSLARALKQSPEFQTFKAAREKVMARESARKMVEDFERRRLELQAQALQGKEPTAEQKESLQKLYEVVSMDGDVRNYLAAEMRFATILSDVQKIIGEAVEVKG